VPQSDAVRWLRGGVAIGGATGIHHKVAARDAGHALRCRVTATNLGGKAVSTSPRVIAKRGANPPRIRIHIAGLHITVSVVAARSSIHKTHTHGKLAAVRGTFSAKGDKIVAALKLHGKRWIGTVKVKDRKRLTRTFTESSVVHTSGHKVHGVARTKVKVKRSGKVVRRRSTLHWSLTGR
jgi:hypothetical protein